MLDAKAVAAAIPDLTDREPPTPVEITLESSSEQVTAVVVAAAVQSGLSLDSRALGGGTQNADSSQSAGSINESSDSSAPAAVKGKSSKQCSK